MESPVLHRLREDFARLQREIESMLEVAPRSYVLADLQLRAERIRAEIDAMDTHGGGDA